MTQRRVRGRKTQILDAILTGHCTTSRDVADETGLPVETCSDGIGKLIRLGAIRQTGRHITVFGPKTRSRNNKYKYRVFEVVA